MLDRKSIPYSAVCLQFVGAVGAIAVLSAGITAILYFIKLCLFASLQATQEIELLYSKQAIFVQLILYAAFLCIVIMLVKRMFTHSLKMWRDRA